MFEKLKNFLRKLFVVQDNAVVEIQSSRSYEVSVSDVIGNPIVRAALFRISQSVASVPIIAYRGETPIQENSQVYKVVSHIASSLPIVIYDLYLFGNSIFLKQKVGDRIISLQHIQPQAVSFDPEARRFIVYAKEGAVEVGEKDVVWFKFVNPIDPEGWGLSIFASIAFNLKVISEIDSATTEFLQNGAIPLGIVKVSKGVDIEEIRRRQAQIEASVGRGRRYKWLAVSKDTDIETVDTSLKLGDLPTLRKTLREEVMAAFNVPPAVLGFYEYANYANSREQTKIFWRDTILPLLRLIENTINNQLMLDFGSDYWVGFDLTQVPYLRENISDVSDALVRMVSAGIVTINEAREIIGKDEPVDWGDVWWGNISTVPIAKPKEDEEVKQFFRSQADEEIY